MFILAYQDFYLSAFLPISIFAYIHFHQSDAFATRKLDFQFPFTFWLIFGIPKKLVQKNKKWLPKVYPKPYNKLQNHFQKVCQKQGKALSNFKYFSTLLLSVLSLKSRKKSWNEILKTFELEDRRRHCRDYVVSLCFIVGFW